MSSYPKVNGNYVDATSKWLNDILRKQWKFNGLVISDWGSASTTQCVANGLDLEMPGPALHTSASKVYEALREGHLSEVDINARVRASLTLLDRVGKFKAQRRHTPKEQAIDRPEHRTLIREAGASGIVLLKNEQQILPLNMTKTKKIALLGPLAKHASAHSGGSSFLTCHYKISPMEAFLERYGSQVEFSSSKGCEIYQSLPDFVDSVTNRQGRRGLDVDYFETFDATGRHLKTKQVHRSYFTTHDQIDIKATAMSTYMSGTYKPKETGHHYLSLSGAGVTKLFVDGVEVLSQDSAIVNAIAFIAGCQDEVKGQHYFEARKTYMIEIITVMPEVTISDSHILDKQLCAHVGFVLQSQMERNLQEESVLLAREADVALVFVGNTYQWESEGQDMASMVLPPYDLRSQDALISAVASANANTVVVMNTGAPVELPWIDEVAALLQGWYAGQEVGNALVDVLVGETNPSGRLPVSWPRTYQHTACYGNFGLDSQESKEVEYVEGIYVGYRHFDHHWASEQEVRFPFGYGLSYTEFEVNNFSVDGSFTSGQVTISANVKNKGVRAGANVLQVYVAPPRTEALDRPIKELGGFTKVFLQPGQEVSIQISLPKDTAAFWDNDISKWSVLAGSYMVSLCTSSSPKDVIGQGEVVVSEGFSFDP